MYVAEYRKLVLSVARSAGR